MNNPTYQPNVMRLVVLESPFRGDADANIVFARACVKDCLSRNEAPIASHLLFTQRGILDDGKISDRTLGISAGHAWINRADAVVVYTDRGISEGMQGGINSATLWKIPVEYRKLNECEVASCLIVI